MSRLQDNRRWFALAACWCVALAAFVAVAVPSSRTGTHLGQPEIITGYSLFSTLLFLLLFNVRKRLPMLPLGRAHWWTMAHLIAGVLVGALFFLHTKTIWPLGTYEQVTTLLFYAAMLSGVFGYVVQRLYPRRLTGRGVEIIYERVPEAIAELREAAESVVLRCTKEANADTLARYYMETFQWYFLRPRFLLSHLTGADKSDRWLDHQFTNSRQYLNDHEQTFLDELHDLAKRKDSIDFHYAAQRLMKVWLLVHVPSVVGLSVLVLWHLLIVNIYGI